MVLPQIMLKCVFSHFKPSKNLFSLRESQQAQLLDMFQKIIIKIGQFEDDNKVPGSKWNLLLPGTSSGK